MSGITGAGGSASTIDWTGTVQRTTARVQRQATDGGSPPPVADTSGGGGTAGSVPDLPSPGAVDASEMMNQFLALRTKFDDEQTKGEVEDIKTVGQAKHDQNLEIAAQMADAAKKQADAKKNDLAMKILGWVAVALTVVAAVAVSIVSFGTLTAVAALGAAAVAVTMAALTESGQMDKWTQDIAQDLMKNSDPPLSQEEAQKRAMYIMMGIQIGVSVLTIAAGAAAAAASGPQIAASIARIGVTATNIARGVEIGANTASAVGTVAQQGMAIDSAVKTKEASDDTAEAMELKKWLAKLQAQQDDDMDRLQTIVQTARQMVTKAMQGVNKQEQSMQAILNNTAQSV